MATAQVSNEPSVGFPPKGSLRKVPFPRLIREVARRKLDGSLYLLSGQTKKVVFFDKGQPVFVRSNVLSECLGQILAQEGLITQEQCEQTLEAIRRTGKKQGELLVEMGILSEGNLRYGLEAQLRAKLFEIFSWEEGRYQFKNDAPELQFGITLKASAEGVILEAIQDQYTEERAGDVLEPLLSKYPVLLDDATSAAELVLLPEERWFLKCLDGSRTLREALDGGSLPTVPSPRSLLCGVMLAGLIKLVDTAQPRRERPAPPEVGPVGGTDDELRPPFEAQALITEYEDTPLPGELPQSPDLLGDHEEGFEGVGEDSGVVRVSSVMRIPEVPEDLLAAEPASIEETFDEDQLELREDSDIDLDIGPPPPLLDAPPTVSDPIAALGDADDDDDAPPPALDDDAALDDLLASDDELSLDFEGEPPTAVDGPSLLAGPEPVAPIGTMPTHAEAEAEDDDEPVQPPLMDFSEPEPEPPPGPAPGLFAASGGTVPASSSTLVPPTVGPFAGSSGTMPTTPVTPPASMLQPPTIQPPLVPPVAAPPTIQPPLVSSATQPAMGSPLGPAMGPPIVPPLAAGSGPVAPAAVPPEDDLFDLAPDDDLLMLDEGVEAVASDLLGPQSGRTQPPSGRPPAPLAAAANDDDDDDGFDGDGFDGEALDDEALLEEVDDLELSELDGDLDGDLGLAEPQAPRPTAATPARAAGKATPDDLLDLEDLDDIDLGGDDAPAPVTVPPSSLGAALEAADGGEPEDMMGALRFNEGQTAVAEGRWEDAVALLEEAYEGGFDVAELHAMLAYARFQASGLDEQTAAHAFELLDYAQQMDPSLDLVHAYRGAIHRAQGDIPQAREALDRALELNPYCELAMEIMDALG
jgi:hypothetical protein